MTRKRGKRRRKRKEEQMREERKQRGGKMGCVTWRLMGRGMKGMSKRAGGNGVNERERETGDGRKRGSDGG